MAINTIRRLEYPAWQLIRQGELRDRRITAWVTREREHRFSVAVKRGGRFLVPPAGCPVPRPNPPARLENMRSTE